MHDVLRPKGMRDLLKFWEISDNISLTVQDRDIVAIEWHSCQYPWMTLKVTCCLKPF